MQCHYHLKVNFVVFLIILSFCQRAGGRGCEFWGSTIGLVCSYVIYFSRLAFTLVEKVYRQCNDFSLYTF